MRVIMLIVEQSDAVVVSRQRDKLKDFATGMVKKSKHPGESIETATLLLLFS